MAEYLAFEREERAGLSTEVWGVYSSRIAAPRALGNKLGEIRWWGRWRQYCFFPSPQTVFNPGCLADISAKCEELTAEHWLAKAGARG